MTASPAASKQEERTKIEERNILHPDCFLSTIAGENIAAVALSLRGKNHIAQGMVLQDYHKLQLMDDQTVFVVVADGVGSEPARTKEQKLPVRVPRLILIPIYQT